MAMTSTTPPVEVVLNHPDLRRFLTKYGDGPPLYAEPADETIDRLVGYIVRARRACGLPKLTEAS